MKPSDAMTCREFVERVTDSLEAALAPSERARFEAHHAACADCRAHLSQVRLTLATLRRLQPSPDEAPPAEEPRRVLDLFRTHGLHTGRAPVRDRPLGLGSGLVAQGDHIAYFWETEGELDATAGYLAAGLSLGEACVLIGQDAVNDRLLAGLERLGLRAGELLEERQIQVAPIRPTAGGLLSDIDERIREAVDRGLPGVRILGNLECGRGTPGWPSDREIMTMEAHVTQAATRLPCLVVCTYNVTRLPADFIDRGGVQCHPLTYENNALQPNARHVPSGRFLAELATRPD